MSAESNTSSDPKLLIGQQIGGFKINRLLGHGGMGQVFEAVQVSVGRPVALKVLKSALQDHERLMRRFQREAQVIAQLNHPNIVTLYDFGSTPEGLSFIAMEFVDGEMLSDYLQEPLEMNFVMHIFQHVLSALQEAHQRGVVHRDLKPDNIMLTTVGVDTSFAKVLDFGLALLANDDDLRLTHAGEVFGTPLYMSPEQASGDHNIGPATDFYSLACIIYELICGRPPFLGRKSMHVLMKHVHEPVPPLEPKPGLDPSPEFIELLMWCLEKDPNNRPQSAESIINELMQTPEAGYFSSSVLPIADLESGEMPSLSLRLTGRTTPHGGMQRLHNTPHRGQARVNSELATSARHDPYAVRQGTPSHPPSLFEMLEGDEGEVLFEKPAQPEATQKSSRGLLLTLIILVLLGGGAAAWFFVVKPAQTPQQTDGSQASASGTQANNNAVEEPETLVLPSVDPEEAAISAARQRVHNELDEASAVIFEQFIANSFDAALAKGDDYRPTRRVQDVRLVEGFTWVSSVHYKLTVGVRDKSYTDPIELLYAIPSTSQSPRRRR